MDYEQEYIEPESAVGFKDGKAEVKMLFSTEALEQAASQMLTNHIEINFMPMLRKRMEEFLKLQGYSRFEDILQKVISEEFLKRYPDVVENKTKEIETYVKNLKPENFRGNYNWSGETIARAAQNKVMEYIEKELKEEVKVTKEYLETFSKNYFANNLFKAMGLMDSMIPQALQAKPLNN